MPTIFGGKKTAVLGARKAQLPFSEGKYQLQYNSVPYNFLSCKFSATASEQIK